MSNFYDLVIADPPFLSDECLTKTALTIKFLAKKNYVLCTGIFDNFFYILIKVFNYFYFSGSIMSELAKRLLNVEVCCFVPHHQNNLANEFYCYSNFDFDKMLQ